MHCRSVGNSPCRAAHIYVFNGGSGPYREDATPDPLNVYGRHKLEAERIVADLLEDYLIVRVCGVYGFEKQGKNFVAGLIARARRGETMNVPSDQWGNPTYSDNLAAAVKELAASRHCGVFNMVGPEHLSRVSFALLACSVFGLDPKVVRPQTTAEIGQRALRPLRGGLDTARVRSLLTTPLVPPRQGLQLMKERLRAEGVMA